MSQDERSFHTVYGRNLVAELKRFAHRPYLVVTMAGLWPTFPTYFDRNMAAVHIEGVEYYFSYALEHRTGHRFIHGQPVCLGVYLASLMQQNHAEEMLEPIRRVGVDIRPQAMGVTWDDIAATLFGLSSFAIEAGLPYGIANEAELSDRWVADLQERVEQAPSPLQARSQTVASPSVLFLMTDQMQAHVLEPGHPCQTPNLDRLGARGVRFTHAYTPNAVCSPARASVMTGLLPHNHGLLMVTHTVDDDQLLLRAGKPHWPRRLAQAGYRTRYFGKWHAEQHQPLSVFGWQTSAETAHGAFVSQASRAKAREMWGGEIREQRHSLAWPLLQNSSASEETYNIPLALSGPGIAHGAVTYARVGSHDVCPTLLELSGEEPFDVPDSRSFATLFPAPTGSPQGFSTGVAEYYGKRMIITPRVVWENPWKLVFNGFDYDELHNLERDPWEMDNFAQDPAHEGQLRAIFSQMWATVRDTGGHSLYNSHYPILRVAPFGPRIAQESTGRGGRTQ